MSAAACLLQDGHEVMVFEQSPVLGEIGAGIQLSANAMHVLNHIGVGEEVSAISVRPRAYVFRLFDTAEVIQEFSLADEHLALHKAPYNQVHRADFHKILVNRVKDLDTDCIHLKKRSAGFIESNDEVKILFDDGTFEIGDLVIGADGVKSRIRDQVCGPVQAVYTGDAAWRVTVPTNDLPPNFIDEVMSVWMGPGRHAVCYYIRSGNILNFVGAVETKDEPDESWTAKFPWERFKADFNGWNEKVQTIIDLVDRDACYRWSMFKRPRLDFWSTNRVTILGDAAHATIPYLAQGAAMAIEDGAVLMRALKKEKLVSDALKLYERNRIDRTARVVEASDANKKLFHLNSVSELRQAFAKRNEGRDRNAWLYSYNPVTVKLI